jgi:hypothetical protein
MCKELSLENLLETWMGKAFAIGKMFGGFVEDV